MIVELVATAWESGPLEVALGFRRRWRGLRPRPEGIGLLLPGNLVHGRGMAEPITAVALDHFGRVTEAVMLAPGRFLRLRGARMVAEVPVGRPPPPVGTTVKVRRVPT